MTLLKEYAMCVTGALISAVALDLFLVPNAVVTGGAGGVGIVLYNCFSVPVSLTVGALNIVLFWLGYRMLKKSVLLKTLVSTIVLIVFIEVFSHFNPLTDDVLMASVFGGLLLGFGTGLVIKSGASTGGSDFGAMLIKRKIHHMPVSSLIMIIDFSIISLSWIINDDPTVIFYAFVSLFVTIKAIDFVVEGASYSKLVFIISDEHKSIAEYILNDIGRGVTSFEARGMYSSCDKRVLMCAVSQRQFAALKTYVLNKDKNAFVILTDARSVYGKGFSLDDQR